MKVKIDTKEKFHVIGIEEPVLYANMTENMKDMLLSFLNNDIKNVVLKMDEVTGIEDPAAESLLNIQQAFYDNNASFVICELQKTVQEKLETLELIEDMNVTPTESEAWDIIQMEEIERELLNDFDE